MSQAPIRLASRAATHRLGALRHDNYRYFLAGQAISTAGTWIQSVGLSWLVLSVTHDPLALGAVVAIQFVPMLVASRRSATLAGRHPRRRVLTLTQAGFAVPALVLFAMSWTHHTPAWALILAALAVGVINLFDLPARQAFLVEMVGRDDLVNAIAVNSTVFNAAAVAGPITAGVLIVGVGLPFCFLANAVSCGAALAGLVMMRNLPALAPRPRRPAGGDQLVEGGRYLFGNLTLSLLLLAVAVFALFATNRLILIPVLSERVLGTGAYGFGIMAGMLALGSLAGTVHLAVAGAQATGRRQLVLAAIWVAVLEGFALSRMLWLSSLLLVAAGYCQICFLAISNSRIQTATPDALRERVLNLYTQVLAVMSPVGAAVTATLILLIGAPQAQALGAAAAGLVVGLIWLLQPAVFDTARQA